jgi:hypothetical protein
MLLMAGGVLSGSNTIAIAMLFISCGAQTLVYAALVTYIEGRQKTELLLSVRLFHSITQHRDGSAEH